MQDNITEAGKKIRKGLVSKGQLFSENSKHKLNSLNLELLTVPAGIVPLLSWDGYHTHPVCEEVGESGVGLKLGKGGPRKRKKKKMTDVKHIYEQPR